MRSIFGSKKTTHLLVLVGAVALSHSAVTAKCEQNQISGGAQPTYSLAQRCAAEAIGTGTIVLGGCGSVCAMKYAGGGVPGWGPAFAFGSSVVLGIFLTGHVSGAHLNPAVTFSESVRGNFNRKEVVPYVSAQCGGATAASAANLLLFRPGITSTMMKSAEGFSGAFGITGGLCKSALGILGAEVSSTACLIYAICGLTNPRSSILDGAAPALIGTTIATLIGIFGPLNGCGMNPARDIGPRLVSMIGGWGKTALSKGWWAYPVGPMIGRVIGSTAYDAVNKKLVEEKQ